LEVQPRSGVTFGGFDSVIRRWLIPAMFLLLAGPLLPEKVEAQQTAEQRIRASQDSLARLRRERDRLQQQLQADRGRVRDLSAEVDNIVRQATTTAMVVRSLDEQLEMITGEVEESTASLIRAEDEILVKRAVLDHRLREIYKRGPLFTLEVLLSAESFGALVARYKYLREIGLRDRALVSRVSNLRDQIDQRRVVHVRLQQQVVQTRDERADEEARLRRLEAERKLSLQRVQQSTRQADQRLAAIARDEGRLNDVMAALEAERRRAAARPNAPAPVGTVFRRGGNVEWPVDGSLHYRFGRAVQADGTQIAWQGIGIAAPVGTEVKAIAAGRVERVLSDYATYGPTVILSHAGGDYSIYASLARVDVAEGAIVSRGTVLGTVGQSVPRQPPHLHFQIRVGQTAVDPFEFLRPPR
jgi:murein hydrolase activator